MKIIAETERLILREFDPVLDAEAYYHLNSQEEVIKYTGNDLMKSVDEARDFLENYDHYEKHNFGRWAVIRKEDNVFVGWCGLKIEGDHIDLGYRFSPQYWGKGYATESARASLNYGFNTLKLKHIIACAMPENKSSFNVMEKLGMVFTHEAEFYGSKVFFYEISR